MVEVQINGFPNYTITDDGHVFSLNYMNTGKKKELKRFIDNRGYYAVNLSMGTRGNKKLVEVHRLVAEHFLPNPDNLPQVNHKDTDKLNPDISNLEWCTQSDNIKHAYDNKLISKTSKRVIQFDLSTGETMAIFDSARDVERQLGISDTAISLCCNGKTKSCRGYGWKFEQQGT